MKPTRRAFVQSIFGVAGAAAVLSVMPQGLMASGQDEPLSTPEWLFTHDAVLVEALRRFDSAWMKMAPAYQVLPEWRGWDGMTTQINAGTRTYWENATDSNPRVAVPRFMESMAAMADEDGIGLFSPLQIPKAVEYAKQAGPLRMVVCWDALTDTYLTRFDVLGQRTRKPRSHSDELTRWSAREQAWQPVNAWMVGATE